MTSNCKNIVFTMVVVLALSSACTATSAWQPWCEEGGAGHQEEIITSVPKIAALGFVRFYQLYISPALRQNKCVFSPSCSRYSVAAINKDGAAMGMLMTFDRLSRCHTGAKHSPYYEMDGGLLKDSPDDNDFWWHDRE